MSTRTYLLFDPVNGDTETFDTLEEANDALASLIETSREDDGWPEEITEAGVFLKVTGLAKKNVVKRPPECPLREDCVVDETIWNQRNWPAFVPEIFDLELKDLDKEGT